MELYLQYIRIIALILLFIITLIDNQFLNLLLNQYVQIFVAVIILLILYYVDIVTAFIISIIITTIFIKLYSIKIPKITNIESKEPKGISSNKDKTNMNEVKTKTLKDKNNYVGVKGVYGEEVYSSQGGHNDISGFEEL